MPEGAVVILPEALGRGAGLLSWRAGPGLRGRSVNASRLLAWCEELAGAPPAFASAMAERILAGYEQAPAVEKRAFLDGLATRFAPDLERLDRAVGAFLARRDPACLTELHAASEPRRQQLLRNLNLASDGTARLIRMRCDLMAFRAEIPNAAALDADLSHLLTSWFNTGFLRFERITWSSPASLLRKIITYEAVHEIGDWEELRRRVEPVDRRCYALFHSRMPDEPLIFVEVALTGSIPASIATLLAPSRPTCRPQEAQTAVFYSISNCQDGLRGVPFGSSLIKQVVDSLRAELPSLRTFVTLSPLPGLRAWTERQTEDPILGPAAREVLAASGDPPPDRVRKLAATYLLAARNSAAEALDPVARFHLGNGASVLDIRPAADPSEKAQRQSFGAMVNYAYDLALLERNRSLHERGATPASARVRAYTRRR